MKSVIKFFFFLSAFTFVLNTASAQFQIRNDEFMQIGYDDYRTLSFGEETNLPNNGKYSIEYLSQAGGLNFWKPWPTPSSGNYILFLRDDKNIGIGTTGSSSYRLDVSGGLRCQSLSFGSDRRLKENIQSLSSSVDKLMQLNAVSYDYNHTADKYKGIDMTSLSENKLNTIKEDGELSFKDGDRMGFIAQEMQEVFPQVVTEDENGLLAINYIDLIPVIVNGIQEQQQTIEELQNDINLLKLENSELRSGTSTNTSIETSQSFLFNNMPNPFTAETTIQYAIANDDEGKTMSILVHDTTGRLVYSEDTMATAGKSEIRISGEHMSDGLHFYSLVIDGEVIATNSMSKVNNK